MESVKWMDLIEKIYKFFKEYGKKHIVTIPIIVIIISFILVYGIPLEEPIWKFEQEDLYESFTTATELNGGEIAVCPQIIVEYNNTIVFIINIEGFYNINVARLETEESKFVLEYTIDKQERFGELKRNIEKLLEEHIVNRYNLEESKKCIVYDIRLIRVIYQTKDNQENKTRYLISHQGIVRSISKKEMRLWNSKNWLDLDYYNPNNSIYLEKNVMEIVSECIEKIDSKIKE